MSRDSIPKTFYFDAEADVSIIVDVHPPRTEECHGIHTFDESEEVDRELLSFKVRVGENEIDFTSRLTPEEKKLIVESKEDV